MTRSRRPFCRLTVVVLAGAILAAGCQSDLRRDIADLPNFKPNVRLEPLRIRLDGFAARFSDTVEASADEIFARSSDAAVRRAALDWKLNAIPACFMSVFRNNALASLLDTMALCHQIERFFTVGAARESFGPHQEIAVEAARRLEASLLDIARTVTRDEEALNRILKQVHDWAAQHPISTMLFERDPVDDMFAEHARGSAGVFEVVGTIEERIEDISTRVRFYVDYLPKRLRWETELLTLHVLDAEPVVRALADFGKMAESAERGSRAAEAMIEAVEKQRIAAFETIREEREAVLAAIDRQRLDTIRAATQERIAVVEALRGERVAAMKDLDAIVMRVVASLEREREAVLRAFGEERRIVVEAGRGERVALAEDLDGIAGRAVDQSAARLEGLVDHFFWRLIQVGAVVLLLAPLLVILVARFLRSRGA
jgi:hypothetical protein